MTNKLLSEHKLVLALDTASDILAIGLAGSLLNSEVSMQIEARREANVRLMPAIDRLLGKYGLCAKQISAVVCGLGPGSFTGVRIAVATAKGIAYGLGVPLYGVSSLDALAWSAWQANVRGTVGVIADAMRGEVYPARYVLSDTGVLRKDQHTVAKAAAVAKSWRVWAAGSANNVSNAKGDGSERQLLLDSDTEQLQSLCGNNERLQLLGSGSERLQLLGDGLRKYASEFFDACFKVLPEQTWHITGTGILYAFMDAMLLGTQGNGNAATVLPIYTRLSDAEENERKRLATIGAEVSTTIRELQGCEPISDARDCSPLSSLNHAQMRNMQDCSPQSTLNHAQMRNMQDCSPLSALSHAPTRDAQDCASAYTKEITYRPMARNDIRSIAALEADTFVAPHASWNMNMLADELLHADRCFWVACAKGAPVAYAGGQIIDANLQVFRVAVASDFRRRGIASKLLLQLAEDAMSLAATSMSLEVRASNVAAQALYASLGMKVIGARPSYFPPLEQGGQREDALIMTCTLPISTAYAQTCVSKNASLINGLKNNMLSQTSPLLLAIETSCDETAAAVINGNAEIQANIIASQVDFHSRFGGVVPEIASRKHTEAIVDVVDAALKDAALDIKNLDAVAVTYAPGLIGALVVGVAFAKGLCWAADKPLVVVNHLEGHIYANKLAKSHTQTKPNNGTDAQIRPPFVVSLLSGGTTMLVHVRDWGNYHILGRTLDDAAGEAFDKVAKALGLGYPGGPIIAKLATQGNADAIDFPRALLHGNGYDFSLSGLKTAVITWIREHSSELTGDTIEATKAMSDVAASFQKAVIDVQVAKAVRACKETGSKFFCTGGGVAANVELCKAYETAMAKDEIVVVYPPKELCTDNAAMIALVALERYCKRNIASLDIDAYANANLEHIY
ncbi:MAG: tRNA (adenosine(37)-N6)-threonylcarbamoyltransferase complex transferase subunit TsaD [Coriobacteriales bacterium]|jgi:N6-L-threonylcarbamoyladenine synthase|nr:tRNA (adenosine(37)-N6)-threonylcarbamoyltransferase complex transferase subunit TsaD [Coriobacteriales bacterium]